MEYQISDEELNYVEDDAISSATSFLNGWPNWNEDEVLKLACDYHGHDYDFAWLAIRVLFGPAVVWLKTGKSV